MLDLSTPCIYGTQKATKDGYVRVTTNGISELAHRKAYRQAYGPIPADAVIEHECCNQDPDCPGKACKHRACINPKHLVARTRAIKGLLERARTLANDVCPEGHEFTEANTMFSGKDRLCRFCRFLKYQEYQRRSKAKEFGIEWNEEASDRRRVPAHDG